MKHHTCLLPLFAALLCLGWAFGLLAQESPKDYLVVDLTTGERRFSDVAPDLLDNTCRTTESLDPALTRPGRFDRRVPVELPDLAVREAILKVHAKKIKIDADVDFHTIARMAAGASGAELANIINEAAQRDDQPCLRSCRKGSGEEEIHRTC